MVVLGGGGEGGCFPRGRVSVGGDEKVLGVDGGQGYTTVRTHAVPRKCRLKWLKRLIFFN